MSVNAEDILGELPPPMQMALKSLDVTKEDPLEVARQMASMPSALLALKGGDGWGMQWWLKFRELMIEYICSDKNGCLPELLNKAGPLKPSVLIQSGSAYIAAAMGVQSGLIAAIVGSVLYQVIKRGHGAWCEVVYKKTG